MHSASQGALKRRVTCQRALDLVLPRPASASLYPEAPKGHTSAGPQQVRQFGDVRNRLQVITSVSARRPRSVIT